MESQDGRSYEDRIKALLFDLESQSRKHILEINELHDYYRPFVNQVKDLELRIKTFKTVFDVS